jgi:hypothetical protein
VLLVVASTRPISTDELTTAANALSSVGTVLSRHLDDRGRGAVTVRIETEVHDGATASVTAALRQFDDWQITPPGQRS